MYVGMQLEIELHQPGHLQALGVKLMSCKVAVPGLLPLLNALKLITSQTKIKHSTCFT